VVQVRTIRGVREQQLFSKEIHAEHVAFDGVWEYKDPLIPRNNVSGAIFFWKSNSELANTL
jgi:hypothetical protein